MGACFNWMSIASLATSCWWRGARWARRASINDHKRSQLMLRTDQPVGIEDKADIISDLEQALAQVG